MNEFVEQVLRKVEKDYGKGVAVNGKDILDYKPMVIPVSPSIDVAISGGIPEGSWFDLVSKEKVGKTTTALHFAANCQKKEYGGREVMYLDIEQRLKGMNLRGVEHLNLDKFHVIRHVKGRVVTGQDFLAIGEDFLKGVEGGVLIVDSYSMICHSNEHEGGIGTSTRGAGGYSLLSGFCRQMAGVVPVMRCIVIGIIQLMANPSGYGSGMTEKGGNAIKYQSDVKLKAKKCEPWLVNGKIIGQIVTWHCMWSALGAPGAEAQSYIRYEHGIDVIAESIIFASDIGLISKAGKWYTLEFMKNHLDLLGVTKWDDETEKKCRGDGMDNTYKMLKNNKGWYNALQKDITKILTGNK